MHFEHKGEYLDNRFSGPWVPSSSPGEGPVFLDKDTLSADDSVNVGYRDLLPARLASGKAKRQLLHRQNTADASPRPDALTDAGPRIVEKGIWLARAGIFRDRGFTLEHLYNG